MSTLAQQLTLAPDAAAGFYAVSMAEANTLLTEWGHYLGACRRPFGQEGWALTVSGRPVSVAVSASSVSSTVTCAHGRTYGRKQLVELARLCSADRWATRPMLRLWREVATKSWTHWPVDAAIAYSKNLRHDGDIYRWDGWERCSAVAGSSGGGTWSKQRADGDEASGRKTLWLYHFDNPTGDET